MQLLSSFSFVQKQTQTALSPNSFLVQDVFFSVLLSVRRVTIPKRSRKNGGGGQIRCGRSGGDVFENYRSSVKICMRHTLRNMSIVCKDIPFLACEGLRLMLNDDHNKFYRDPITGIYHFQTEDGLPDELIIDGPYVEIRVNGERRGRTSINIVLEDLLEKQRGFSFGDVVSVYVKISRSNVNHTKKSQLGILLTKCQARDYEGIFRLFEDNRHYNAKKLEIVQSIAQILGLSEDDSKGAQLLKSHRGGSGAAFTNVLKEILKGKQNPERHLTVGSLNGYLNDYFGAESRY